ncbi:MAG TPA: sensor histidine kinase [Gammaproteobacteria bacterium]
MHSLASRLSSGLLISLLIAFALLAVLVSVNIRYVTDDYVASRLQHDTETLLAAVSFDTKGRLLLDAQRIDQVYNQPFSGHYYVISSGTQSHYSRSLWDQRIEHVALESGEQRRVIQSGPEQQSLLVLSSGYTLQGYPLSISLAEDLNPIRQNIEQFIYMFIFTASGILLILIVLQVLILRHSLKPLQQVKQQLVLLEQGKIERLDSNVPAEIEPVINEVNHLLTVMGQRLQRSRDGLGDLAHAIKKPLTVMRQVLRRMDASEPDRETLTEQVDVIVQLSDRILKRARLAGHSHSGKYFCFDKDLSALIDTLGLMYPQSNIQIEQRIDDNVNCPIDREDMMELLGNLLDNACKWAQHKVRITVSSDQQLNISVEDDGPGIAADQVHELSRRGRRLDESVEGHGFGLAIASDTVSEYQGQMRFSKSTELGGLNVDIVLPLRHKSLESEK